MCGHSGMGCFLSRWFFLMILGKQESGSLRKWVSTIERSGVELLGAIKKNGNNKKRFKKEESTQKTR